MQLEDFYTLNNLEVNDNSAIAKITINKNHNIFDGHFPGNPITPGVCIMQIIKEITEKITEKPLFMESSSNIKFMAIINPEKNPDLVLSLDISESEEGFKVKNITKFDDTVALKLTTSYSIKKA